jgi:hypothetical protein
MNNQSQRGRLSANILVNCRTKAYRHINSHLIHKISCRVFRKIKRVASISLGGIASLDIALVPIQLWVSFQIGKFRDNSPERHICRPDHPHTKEVNKNRMAVHAFGKIDGEKQSGKRGQAQEI